MAQPDLLPCRDLSGVAGLSGGIPPCQKDMLCHPSHIGTRGEPLPPRAVSRKSLSPWMRKTCACFAITGETCLERDMRPEGPRPKRSRHRQGRTDQPGSGGTRPKTCAALSPAGPPIRFPARPCRAPGQARRSRSRAAGRRARRRPRGSGRPARPARRRWSPVTRQK